MERLCAFQNSIQSYSPLDFKVVRTKSPPHNRHFEPLSKMSEGYLTGA
jgi:hypothetical protein